jgi:hypothetical protein
LAIIRVQNAGTYIGILFVGMKLSKIAAHGIVKNVAHVGTDTSDDKKSNAPKGQGEPDEGRANSIDQLKEQIGKQVADTISWVSTCDSSFLEFEQQLIPKVYELGRLFISLFLWAREEYWQRSHAEVEKGLKCQGLKDRLVCTIFGKVRYWRSYVYRGKYNGGYYPLDIELGLPWDGLQHAGPKLRGSAGEQN